MQGTTRPSAEQLQSLTEAYRRDPSSTYVELGQAFMALGRPRDAIEVGSRGLQGEPNDIGGRLMVSRAYIMLHQWKEAQAELLRLVKQDRTNGEGFRLLGEVLMRRSDFDRALPVLQHAQNLDPANPGILSLVKRARLNQPLDPPPPIPKPRSPAGEARARLPEPAMDAFREDTMESDTEEPTNLMSRGMIEAKLADAQKPRPRPRPSEPPPLSEFTARESASDASPEFAAPEGHEPIANRPMVRPRVFQAEKSKDAAQASLRQSAAVGEDYLNQLLTNGLLDLPNVRVPDDDFDVGPGKRWGRSSGRAFIYLFTVLFLGVAAGGGWYWYAAKQRNEAMAKYIAKSKSLLSTGHHKDLSEALDAARTALDLDLEDTYSIAVVAESMGLISYLYDEEPPSRVEMAVEAASREITKPEQAGYRELMIARAASTLALLPQINQEGNDEDVAERRLRDIRKELKGFLASNPDDHVARWLYGRALLVAGERKEAIEAFTQADARGEGFMMAAIDRADLLVDDDKLDEALAIYDEVLKKSPDHPWAFVGRELAKAERHIEFRRALEDLNAGIGDKYGPRIQAYKHLANAYAQFINENFEAMKTELTEAVGVENPRFLARVARARLRNGDIMGAGNLRTNIHWYGKDPQPDPMVDLVDAELTSARGLPAEVLKQIGKRQGVLSSGLRGRAYFDLGKYEEAVVEFDTVLKAAPDDIESQAWRFGAQIMVAKGQESELASEELDKLGRKSENKLPRLVSGLVLVRRGKVDAARDEFELSLQEISDRAPNPLAYRSKTELAKILVRIGGRERDADDPEAEKESTPLKTAASLLEEALKENPLYIPAMDLLGQLLNQNDPARAYALLAPVIEEGIATGRAELAFASVVARVAKDPKDRDKARAAMRRAKEKGGASTEELCSVAKAVDAALIDELSLGKCK